MQIEYEFRTIVMGQPPRTNRAKQIIALVRRTAHLEELGEIHHAATLDHDEGDSDGTRYFADGDGGFYRDEGEIGPDTFSDREGGLPVLRGYRDAVATTLTPLPVVIRRNEFYPGSRIVNAWNFEGADINRPGFENVQHRNIETACARIEAELGRYHVKDGRLFYRVPEPVLVLSIGPSSKKSFRIDVEFDHLSAAEQGGFTPVACFGLSERAVARRYVEEHAGMRHDEKFRLDSGRTRVVWCDPSQLRGDGPAMTLKLVAHRMLEGYLSFAENYYSVRELLTNAPISEQQVVRALHDAMSRDEHDLDEIERAVEAGLSYVARGGREVFVWSENALDDVHLMMDHWRSRPVDIDPVFSVGFGR